MSGLERREDSASSGLRSGLRDKTGRDLDLTRVRGLLDRIVVRWRPHQIWLFGSRARGTEHPDSDWDLLVVVPDETADSELDPTVVWEVRREAGAPADVVPFRLREFREDLTTVNTLPSEVSFDGVLLYER